MRLVTHDEETHSPVYEYAGHIPALSLSLSLVIVSLPRENTSSRVASWYVVKIYIRGSNLIYSRARFIIKNRRRRQKHSAG